VEIADQYSHQLIAYIAAVQRHGHKLSVSEFRAYANNPRLKMTGGFTVPAVARALGIKPAESRLEFLYRLGWIDIQGPSPEIEPEDTVVITGLGRAVLASLEEGSLEQEIATTIVLDQDDPIAKARVMAEIASAGRGALIDRYFSADDFLAILQRTEITRVLTGSDPRKGRLAGLQQALADVKLPRDFEIRTTDAFHDRFVVPDHGPVRQIGTSLGGISKRLSVMVTMTDDAASSAIRASFEQAWSEGSTLDPSPAPDTTVDGQEAIVKGDHPAPGTSISADTTEDEPAPQ
jgi:hypothetical protein